MLIRATILGLMLTVGACGGDKKGADEDEVADCETDDDCEAGHLCMDNECTDTTSKGVYSGKSNNLTPAKVKKEVEKRGQVHTDNVDKALDME